MEEKRKLKTELLAQEIRAYLENLILISKIREDNKGDVTNRSVLSFGAPTTARYELTDDGKINAWLDFSSVAWAWDDGKNQEVDVNLDLPENHVDNLWTWRINNHRGFIHTIDKDAVDFEALKEELREKYGIDCGFSYDEKVYSKTYTNGSEDRVSTDRCNYYRIDSNMFVSGMVKDLERNYYQQENVNNSLHM